MGAGSLSSGDDPGLAEAERRNERWDRSVRLHRSVIALVCAAWGQEESPSWLDRMTEHHCRFWIEQLREKLCGESLMWAADTAGEAFMALKAAASDAGDDLLCGFCGGSRRNGGIGSLIAGYGARICERCVVVSENILQEALGDDWTPGPGARRDAVSWPPPPGSAAWPPGTIGDLPEAAAALSGGLRVTAVNRRAPWPVLAVIWLCQAGRPGKRARLYWSTIALALAAWGRNERPAWLDDATRRRARAAVSRASKVFRGYGARTSIRRNARLRAAQGQVDAALAEVAKARGAALARGTGTARRGDRHSRADARACSFCGCGQQHVPTLIAGLSDDAAEIGGYICERCVARCVILCDQALGADWRSAARRSHVYRKYADGSWYEYTDQDGVRVGGSLRIDEGPRLIHGR